MSDKITQVAVGIESEFMDQVWSALKADANDLRKQQRILQAFRDTLAVRVAEITAERDTLLHYQNTSEVRVCGMTVPEIMNMKYRIEVSETKLSKAIDAIEFFMDGWGLDGTEYEINPELDGDFELHQNKWAFDKFRETLKEIK
jgi:hypothetical protein